MKSSSVPFIIILILLIAGLSGCLEETKEPSIQISYSTSTNRFPIKITITNIIADKDYDWNEINISVSNTTKTIYIFKEGVLTVGDVIEIPHYMFEGVESVNVVLKLISTGETIENINLNAPQEKPQIIFTTNQTSNQIIVSEIVGTYSWLDWMDFKIIASNSTKTNEELSKGGSIDVGDTINVNSSRLYGTVTVELIWEPTNEDFANYTFNVAEPDPEISLSSYSGQIYWSDQNPTSRSFYINIGIPYYATKQVIWQITEDLPSWLTISPMNGILKPIDQSTRVNYSVNNEGLTSGDYYHNISIATNYGNKEFQVHLVVP